MKLLKLLSNVVSVAFILMLSAIASAQSMYDFNKGFEKGTFEFDLSGNYFFSEANYLDEADTFDSLASGNSLKLLTMDFGMRWVPKTRYGILAQVILNNVETNTSGIVRTNSTVSDYRLGADALFYWGKVDMVPSVVANIPLQRVDTTTDTAINSDGVTQIHAQMLFRKAIGSMMSNVRFGYMYQDDGRASLLPYGAGLQWSLPSIDIGTDLSGYQKIGYDTETDTPNVRHAITDRVNGGSYRFYSVNPTLLEFNAWLKYNLDNSIGMWIGGGSTLTGSNSAAGYSIFARLTYGFETSPTRPQIPGLPPDKALEKFKEETSDGVDQGIFQPAPPPPAYVPPPPEKKTVIAPQKAIPQTGGDTPPAGTIQPKTTDEEIIRSVDDLEVQLKKEQKKKRKRSK